MYNASALGAGSVNGIVRTPVPSGPRNQETALSPLRKLCGSATYPCESQVSGFGPLAGAATAGNRKVDGLTFRLSSNSRKSVSVVSQLNCQLVNTGNCTFPETGKLKPPCKLY